MSEERKMLTRTGIGWGVESFSQGVRFPPELLREAHARERAEFFLEEAIRAEERGNKAATEAWLKKAEEEEKKIR